MVTESAIFYELYLSTGSKTLCLMVEKLCQIVATSRRGWFFDLWSVVTSQNHSASNERYAGQEPMPQFLRANSLSLYLTQFVPLIPVTRICQNIAEGRGRDLENKKSQIHIPTWLRPGNNGLIYLKRSWECNLHSWGNLYSAIICLCQRPLHQAPAYSQSSRNQNYKDSRWLTIADSFLVNFFLWQRSHICQQNTILNTMYPSPSFSNYRHMAKFVIHTPIHFPHAYTGLF